jgi:hypothetical protein
MKAAGVFILKSITFSIIFLTISVVILSVFYNFRDRAQTPSPSNTAVAPDQEQNDSSSALMKKYWLQVEEADRLYEMGRKQQTQAAEQLKKQDELLARWQKVIERWEKVPAK